MARSRKLSTGGKHRAYDEGDNNLLQVRSERARWSVGNEECGVYTTMNAQTETNEGAVSAGRTIDIKYKQKDIRIWHEITCSTTGKVDHVT